MSYVAQHLMPGERIEHMTQLHWVILLPAILTILLGLLFLLVDFGILLGIGIVWLIFLVLKRKASEFAVTNRRFIAKTGLLSHRAHEMQLHKVENVIIDQPLDGRWLGYGTVTVTGTGGSPLVFNRVQNPHEVRKAIHVHSDASSGNRNDEAASAARGQDEPSEQRPKVATSEDIVTQLERLASLRERGALSEEEFQAQKRRLLGG